MRSAAAAVALAICACSDPPFSGPPAEMAGAWAFGQRFSTSPPGDPCRNHGTLIVQQSGTSFDASYTRLGSCGFGVTDWEAGTISEGRLGGDDIEFVANECRYRGTVVGTRPDGAQGSVTCRIPQMGGSGTVTYNGSWSLHRGVAGLTLTPLTGTVGLTGELPLTATAYDASGAVMTRRFVWSAPHPVISVDENGVVRGVVIGGSAPVVVTTVPGVPLEDSVSATALVRVGHSFSSVTTGWLFSCGLTTDGHGLCWGRGFEGQLGSGGYGQPLVPAPIQGDLSFTKLSAGWLQGCGITTGDVAYCWGRDLYGEVGDGPPNETRPTPVPVAGGVAFASISAGNNRTCGLTAAGAAYCWGEVGGDTPVRFADSIAFRMISLSKGGEAFACGVSTTNVAYCWGWNGSGQLGHGGSERITGSPVAVAGGHAFATVSAGADYACGITTTSAAYCWGKGTGGQLGWGVPSSSAIPAAVVGGHSFSQIAASGAHTCALATTGVAYCWGFNGLGQLGTGTPVSQHDSPQPVYGGMQFRSIESGAAHTCAVDLGGLAYCWGRGMDGQIGNGSLDNQNTPKPVGV